MKKHAFLIIANRNFNQLAKLVGVLDDIRNDIYVLIDKTSEERRVSIHTNNANLKILSEMPIYWGDYSQIEAELVLFTVASEEHYEYYHLLSGLDLPLSSQDEIHDFFDRNPNKQFVSYSEMVDQKSLRLRLRKHLFRKSYRCHLGVKGKVLKIYRHCEQIYLKTTDVFVAKDKIEFGSNWVSLSDRFVQKLVEEKNRKEIRLKFSGGFLVDELLIPYEIKKLNFEDTVYYRGLLHNVEQEFQGNVRYINWWDGTPYVWRKRDYNRLVKARKAGHLFARKFDEKIDAGIVDRIIEDVKDVD